MSSGGKRCMAQPWPLGGALGKALEGANKSPRGSLLLKRLNFPSISCAPTPSPHKSALNPTAYISAAHSHWSATNTKHHILSSHLPSLFCVADLSPLFVFQQSLRKVSRSLCPGTPPSTAWSSKSARSVRSGVWEGCFRVGYDGEP